MADIPQSLEAIQKKITGERLTYKEIFAIMDDISHNRLGDILTTYFSAAGYSQGFSNEELYFLTKAMIDTGERLQFPGIVADKHSVGGVPGTRTTLILVPIIAAAGFTIPKSSSRAITTPGGTGDDMEVLAPVTFTKEQIYDIVNKVHACIVWGGGVDIAPADDELIKVEQPLLLESFDKILVSIMAKKVAFGATHVVIDLPYGKYVKVHTEPDALLVKRKFEFLARRFGLKIDVLVHRVIEPAGRGLGPLLETRDALCVLEQRTDRPVDLENHAIMLAGHLLDLCQKDTSFAEQKRILGEFGTGKQWAQALLKSGAALKKMKEIIQAQGGNSAIISKDLVPGKYFYTLEANERGGIQKINSRNASLVAKVLGAPTQKKSGIYLHKKIGESVRGNEPILTLYSETAYHLKEGRDTLENFPVVTVA
ncbi:MAG: thymidine phosphorylase [Patescibacteria group bacterium]